MIISRLEQIATDKGFDRSKLGRAADVSYPAILYLWNRKPLKQIDGSVLDKLCSVLGCQPGDLLVRVIDES